MEATEGRKCLCNGLTADAGMPQISPFKKEGSDTRYMEEILVTAGDDVNICRKFMLERDIAQGKFEFPANRVIRYLLGRFKEEYSSEARLYQDASAAEEPDVRETLLARAEKLAEKIEQVDRQLGDSTIGKDLTVAATLEKPTDADAEEEAARLLFARFDEAFLDKSS